MEEETSFFCAAISLTSRLENGDISIISQRSAISSPLASACARVYITGCWERSAGCSVRIPAPELSSVCCKDLIAANAIIRPHSLNGKYEID